MLLLFDDSFSNKPVSRDLKEVSGLICLLFGGIYYRLYIADELSVISVDFSSLKKCISSSVLANG